MSTTRRHFLQSGSAVTMLAAPALAQTPKGANDRVNVACIGFGIMGQGDVSTINTVPGAKLVAVSDIYEGRLTKAREVYGKDIFTTRDYREILARPDIDAVIVATPDHWHQIIACDAMRAGKDVYCQKPMVQKVEEGAAVIKAEKETNRILQVGSQRASSILYAKAREVIKQGSIGDVRMVEAYWDRNSAQGAWQYSIPPDATPQTVDWDRFLGHAPKRPFEPIRLFRWRNYQDYGTGVAGDLYVHLFTGIHYVMDSSGPNRIMSTGGLYYWKDGRDVPDLMLGMYDYPDTKAHKAFHLSIRLNFEAGGGEGSGFRFIGTEGVLDLAVGGALVLKRKPKDSEPGHTAGTFSKATGAEIVREYQKKYPVQRPSADGMRANTEQRWVLPPGYTEQYAHHENFINAVRSRNPVIEDATFGLRAAGPALLSNVSHFTRKTMLWDPESMVIKQS
ncbi:MAG: Gfo/Idh/MocA family oxidoreductase [Bryobacterales bacterium]|nr:Gfo/Idh/MocA family oxidoreductase [Bryobacterales bacterium]